MVVSNQVSYVHIANITWRNIARVYLEGVVWSGLNIVATVNINYYNILLDRTVSQWHSPFDLIYSSPRCQLHRRCWITGRQDVLLTCECSELHTVHQQQRIHVNKPSSAFLRSSGQGFYNELLTTVQQGTYNKTYLSFPRSWFRRCGKRRLIMTL
jgi:hypothetical protein